MSEGQTTAETDGNGESDPGAQGAENEEGGVTKPIVVVDADAASRNRAEDLEDDLDQQVIAIDSMDFDIDASQEILDAELIILSWDLGIRSGADLLEAIRTHDQISKKIVLIATEAPTASLVRFAMRQGADGVCCKPYDADEIQVRRTAIAARAAGQAA